MNVCLKFTTFNYTPNDSLNFFGLLFSHQYTEDTGLIILVIKQNINIERHVSNYRFLTDGGYRVCILYYRGHNGQPAYLVWSVCRLFWFGFIWGFHIQHLNKLSRHWRIGIFCIKIPILVPFKKQNNVWKHFRKEGEHTFPTLGYLHSPFQWTFLNLNLQASGSFDHRNSKSTTETLFLLIS